jgi:hypothetical protein
VTDRKNIIAGLESSDRAVFFPALRAMLDDLGVEHRQLSDAELESAVVLFDDLFESSTLSQGDATVLYRFAKLGGLPWLTMLSTSSPR